MNETRSLAPTDLAPPEVPSDLNTMRSVEVVSASHFGNEGGSSGPSCWGEPLKTDVSCLCQPHTAYEPNLMCCFFADKNNDQICVKVSFPSRTLLRRHPPILKKL